MKIPKAYFDGLTDERKEEFLASSPESRKSIVALMSDETKEKTDPEVLALKKENLELKSRLDKIDKEREIEKDAVLAKEAKEHDMNPKVWAVVKNLPKEERDAEIAKHSKKKELLEKAMVRKSDPDATETIDLDTSTKKAADESYDSLLKKYIAEAKVKGEPINSGEAALLIKASHPEVYKSAMGLDEEGFNTEGAM